MIASYIIFKLSNIVSTGHINVPSDDIFNDDYPPLPLTIFLRILPSTCCARYASLQLFLVMSVYLYILHFEFIDLPPCRQFIIRFILLFVLHGRFVYDDYDDDLLLF